MSVLNYDALRKLRADLTVAVASIDLLLATETQEPTRDEPHMISKSQIAAFHAMTSALDDRDGVPRGTYKARIKRSEGKESTKDFTWHEAHQVLDLIAMDLDGLTPA